MTDREHIGYTEREEGFYKLYAPPKGSIVTHAFILCKYCNGAIYHCMGPKYDAVCLTCYEKEPELRNLIRGADMMAGDGGYSEGTREAYEEFNRKRNYKIPGTE